MRAASAVLLVACSAACQDPAVPKYELYPSAPTIQVPTTLKLSALNGIGTTAQHAYLTAALRDQQNRGIADVMLTFTTSNGTIEPAAVKTNINGDAKTTVTSGTDVRVTVSGAGLTTGMDVSITAPLSVSLSIGRAEKNVATKLEARITGDATPPLRFVWNFGDGQTAQTDAAAVTHTWVEDGPVTVAVTVTDAIDRTGSSSTGIVVRDNPEPPAPPPPTPPPPPPTPTIDVGLSVTPLQPTAGQLATLTAVVTPHNNPPAVTSFDWDCTSDGTIDGTTAANSFQCTYAAAGTFTAKAIAHADTVTGTGTLAITVGSAPPPPVPAVTVTLMATPNSGQFGVTIVVLTPTSTPMNGAGPVVSYDWDLDGNGTFERTTTGPLSVNGPGLPQYPSAGTYTTKVRANSSTVGVTGTASAVVAIIN